MQHLDSLNYFAADRSYFTPHTYPDLAPESAYSFADYLNTLQNLPQPPLSEPAIPAPEDDREFKEAQQYGAEKTTPHDKTDIPIKADGEEPGSAAAVKTFTAKSNSANETANEKPAPLSAAAANETGNETANETGGAAGTVGTATSEKIVDATASADKNSVLEKNQSDPQNTMGNESFSNEEDENHFVDHKTDDRKISFLKQQKEPASGQAKSRHAATRQSSTRRPVSGQVSAHQVSAHQANRLEHNSEGASDIEHSAGNAEHSPLPALASSGDENQQGNREGGTFSNIMFQNTENNANPRNNTAEIQVFLVPDAQGAQGAANTSPDGIGGEAPARTMSSAEFMDQFRAQFRQQLGSDIVRHARYILRGQNAGEISLVLKPEKFGRVRIRMQLEDKSIDGKIFVENKYVKEAFVEVLDDLKQAFAEQGFDDLNVDINLEDESLGENLLAENTSSPSSQFQASHESHERELEAAQAYIREFDSVNILA
ncbi:MAG: flagellar hook-length control protein FliK [Salinispira sp.]